MTIPGGQKWPVGPNFRVSHPRCNCELLGWVDTHHGVSTEEAEEKTEVQAASEVVEEEDDDEICDMEDFEDDDDLVIRK